MSERDVVLITGAGGLVGAEVVARLVGAGTVVAGLLHSNSRIVRNDGTEVHGVDTVRGDVRSRNLGLSRADLAALGDRVGMIVHSAATTASGLPLRRRREKRDDDAPAPPTFPAPEQAAQEPEDAARWAGAFFADPPAQDPEGQDGVR